MHALGFGIYRPPQKSHEIGLVQMFDQPALWQEIGYRIESGSLEKGKRVVLARTSDTSPRFLEDHSNLDDLVDFKCFKNEAAQRGWIVQQIRANLKEDELRHDDIIVIHPNPVTARERLGPVRRELYALGIQTHLAGVDTDADVFFRSETPSVTFTGIYRAKGNEAGMVYVINAQDCDGTGLGLSTLRNRLFTAITRGKAWVRVIGFGPRMDNLIAEFNELGKTKFKLDFKYPNDEQLSKLRVVHRDLSPQEKERLERKLVQATDLAEALERGELNPEDLDEETRIKLLRLLGAVK
jgi:superfamily I DNA and RNA helicase